MHYPFWRSEEDLVCIYNFLSYILHQKRSIHFETVVERGNQSR